MSYIEKYGINKVGKDICKSNPRKWDINKNKDYKIIQLSTWAELITGLIYIFITDFYIYHNRL